MEDIHPKSKGEIIRCCPFPRCEGREKNPFLSFLQLRIIRRHFVWLKQFQFFVDKWSFPNVCKIIIARSIIVAKSVVLNKTNAWGRKCDFAFYETRDK